MPGVGRNAVHANDWVATRSRALSDVGGTRPRRSMTSSVSEPTRVAVRTNWNLPDSPKGLSPTESRGSAISSAVRRSNNYGLDRGGVGTT